MYDVRIYEVEIKNNYQENVMFNSNENYILAPVIKPIQYRSPSTHELIRPYKITGPAIVNILQPMKSHVVFSAQTELNHNKENRKEVFQKAAGYIYDWIRLKYGNIFPKMSENIESYFKEENGFQFRHGAF